MNIVWGVPRKRWPSFYYVTHQLKSASHWCRRRSPRATSVVSELAKAEERRPEVRVDVEFKPPSRPSRLRSGARTGRSGP
jgi:hypothetical protein